MPGGDRTGPSGMGPMTGRGAGDCAGIRMPGYTNRMRIGGGSFGGRAFGRGRGGRGWRNWYHATGLPGYVRAAQGMQAWGRSPDFQAGFQAAEPSGQDELEVLRAQSRQISRTLEDINKRIGELESD